MANFFARLGRGDRPVKIRDISTAGADETDETPGDRRRGRFGRWFCRFRQWSG
jgi:hypothetical protein